MSTYELSARARLDLLGIWDHLAEHNIDAADKVVADLQAAMVTLAEFPGMGHQRADVPDPRFRFWRVRSFIIAYVPGTHPLSINRVVHGHRNFRELFPASKP